MTVDRYSHLQGFRPGMRGDGIIVGRQLDSDALKAPRPAPRNIRTRKVKIERQTYVAYDAHSLLEHEDYGRLARPGHPLG